MIYICGVSLFGLVAVTVFMAFALCNAASRADDLMERMNEKSNNA